MSDENRMYELEYPSPEVGSDQADGPTMIIALQGYADAGHAIDGVSRHLRAALESATIASFSNDELIDYRSRRPAVTLEQDHLGEFTDLQLDIRVLRDANDKPFLLLSGPEPDFRWESFTQAVADLADKYRVGRTISLYASPMQVPHTRPMVVMAHGNSKDLVGDLVTWDARLTVPGAAALFIERELHKRGHNVGGFTAQVPHYLSQSPYPLATHQLLTAIQDATGLKFPLRSLEADIQRANQQLGQYMEANPEIMHLVHALEAQYDQELERYRQKHPDMRLPGEEAMPSGDELGAEFEAFLASIEDGTNAPEEPTSRGRGELNGPSSENIFPLGEDAGETDEDTDPGEDSGEGRRPE
ncbi:PAC2 family protein [Corynebacterium guangdongense]|uniref:PAC2 family protein n=1 Tax=Corynebacterium guangdongense TaxID=1783348 RepID=A0ABU1ZYN4_9CORY|nr:PAC2 family protein [Corynebacterium guangdongense]MDR7329503.1 hypothetical protein [Corynebacterium guangdongense]WJZ18068.1 PAC2 family protein [Corynebacterium guangdongense]